MGAVEPLNYQHLSYFVTIAEEGTILTDAELGAAIDRARVQPRAWVCVECPAPSLVARLWLIDAAARRGARLVAELAGQSRVAVSDGDAWSAWLSLDGCPPRTG